jgi:large subunit ribosomal protein L10
MTRADKQATIDQLKNTLGNSDYFYLTDTSGLNVEDFGKLRRICFAKGIKIQVAKNTFIRKALDGCGKLSDDLDAVLHGTTALMISDTGNLPAKVIKEFRGDKEKPAVKAAYIDSAVFAGDNQLAMLVALKTKNELIGDVIGLLQSPAKNVISALKSSGHTIAGLVKALEERNN